MNMQHFWSFFAFPLNLLLAVLWVICWRWFWKNRPESRPVRFMLSPAATISAILLLLASCMFIGFTGNRDFVMSFPFVILMLYVQTVLMMVIFRGWKKRNGAVRWRFLLLHAGLLLALGSGFWGAPDSSELRTALGRGEMTETAFREDGSVTGLGYSLKMLDYKIVLSDSGVPSAYEAVMSVDEGEAVNLTVNDPFSVGFGEDIYLASVTDKYCVLQIVREPWRYFALAGIIMLLAGAFMLFIKGPRR